MMTLVWEPPINLSFFTLLLYSFSNFFGKSFKSLQSLLLPKFSIIKTNFVSPLPLYSYLFHHIFSTYSNFHRRQPFWYHQTRRLRGDHDFTTSNNRRHRDLHRRGTFENEQTQKDWQWDPRLGTRSFLKNGLLTRISKSRALSRILKVTETGQSASAFPLFG